MGDEIAESGLDCSVTQYVRLPRHLFYVERKRQQLTIEQPRDNRAAPPTKKGTKGIASKASSVQTVVLSNLELLESILLCLDPHTLPRFGLEG
jgi:hypothetical protein